MHFNQWLTAFSLGIFLSTMPFVEAATTENRYSEDTVNGIDVKILNGLIERLKKDSMAGQATFFSDTQWKGGMKSLTTISGYSIDGKMKAHKRKFTLQGDEMSEIGGTDTAPGAIEEMMYAVGTCIVAAANANAALMGVKLTKINVALESDIDMHGLLGLDPKVRPGLLNFRTTITIAGDADDETLKKIAMKGYTMSPVSDTVRNGTSFAEKPQIIIAR